MPTTQPSAHTIRTSALTWAIWTLLIAALYYPTYQIFPYYDDVAHVEGAAHYGTSIIREDPVPMFRPFERIINGLSWQNPVRPWWHAQPNPFWFAKTSSLLFLLLKVGLVGYLARTVLPERDRLLRLAVPLLYLFHPMHVAAVIKIDTISENLAALVALCVVSLLARLAMLPRESCTSRLLSFYVFAAAMLTLVGMLSKEAYFGMAAATPLLIAIAVAGVPRRKLAFTFASSALLTALLAALYFGLRRLEGYQLGGYKAGRYHLTFGINVLINSAASIGASLFPGNTMKIFAGFDFFYVLLAVGLILAILLLYWRSYFAFIAQACTGRILAIPNGRILLLALLATFASLLPGCMVSELISENQTESTIPFVILLVVGIPAVSSVASRWQKRPQFAFLPIALVFTAATLMANATTEKVAAAHRLSDRAYHWGDVLVEQATHKPVPHFFLCIAPVTPALVQPKYSIFSVPDSTLAATQLYRLHMANYPGAIDFIPVPGPVDQHICSMTFADQQLYPGVPH